MIRKAPALAAVLLLAACTPQIAAGVTAAAPPAAVADLQKTCSVAQPILALGTSSTAPATVSGIATYGQAYCAQLLAGSTPPTTDANTPAWLASILNAAQLAAQVAGMVMPLVALF